MAIAFINGMHQPLCKIIRTHYAPTRRRKFLQGFCLLFCASRPGWISFNSASLCLFAGDPVTIYVYLVKRNDEPAENLGYGDQNYEDNGFDNDDVEVGLTELNYEWVLKRNRITTANPVTNSTHTYIQQP